MENEDLRSLWQEIHTADTSKSIPENIQTAIRLKHCRVISKILSGQKRKVWLYSVAFIVSLLLCVWDLTITTKLSLSLLTVTAFFLFSAFSEISRFCLLSQSADTVSIKESTYLIRRKLDRTKKISFAACLLFFYGTAIRFTIVFLNDYQALKEQSLILIVFVLILLVLPWLIKYQHSRQYKQYISSLEKSINSLGNIRFVVKEPLLGENK